MILGAQGRSLSLLRRVSSPDIYPASGVFMAGEKIDVERVLKLADALWSRREEIDPRYQEIAEYVYPDRAGFGGKKSPADDGRDRVFDTTPEEAADMLSAALHSLLTNPASAWFALDLPGIENEDEAVTRWLTDVQRVMLTVFNDPATRFGTEISTFYGDLGPFGWAVFFVDDAPGEPVRFDAIPPYECAIGADGRGEVRQLVRRYRLGLDDIAEMFGADALTQEMRDAAKDTPLHTLEIVHAVLPWKSVPGLAEGRFPFASLYIARAQKHVLRVGGYYEFPYLVPRWSRASGDVYGRGPGWRSLPDMRVLNAVAAAQMMAAEKQADPPLCVPDDGALSDVRTWAGGITYLRQGASVAPLPVATDLAAMEAILESRRNAVRAAFLNDRIQLVGGPQMTATEVLSRDNKQMLVLGPVLGRMQSEFLGPLIERVFNILVRRGEIPDPPENLRGRALRVRYVSPIARAQKQMDAAAFTQAVQFLAPLGGQPEIWDNFDTDNIARDSQELFGYPAKYLRPVRAVEELRKARAAAQQIAALPAGQTEGMA